jgi:hypothetical protein
MGTYESGRGHASRIAPSDVGCTPATDDDDDDDDVTTSTTNVTETSVSA